MCAQTSATVIGFRRGVPTSGHGPDWTCVRVHWVRLPISATVRRAQSGGSDPNGRHDRPPAPTRRTLETILMKRQIGHPAAHPYRLTRAAIQAHREHLPTPFLGCPVCALRAPVGPLKIRWMSPRRA